MLLHIALKTKHIEDLHLENITSLNKLIFCQKNLVVLQKHFDDIAAQGKITNATPRAQHWRKQLIIQGEANDALIQRAHGFENELARYAKNHPVPTNHTLFQTNENIIADVVRFENRYVKMHEEFVKFVAKYI